MVQQRRAPSNTHTHVSADNPSRSPPPGAALNRRSSPNRRPPQGSNSANSGPPLVLLRLALLLPLVTLSVILFAGFSAVPSHVPSHPLEQHKNRDVAEAADNQHPLHKVVLQARRQGQLQTPQQQRQHTENTAATRRNGTVVDRALLHHQRVRHTPKVTALSSAVQYHIIFSTGCSAGQDWQSYLFFYHAWKSGQPGHVTRIVSGCPVNDQNATRMAIQEFFDKQIEPMTMTGSSETATPRFHLHFTPDFSNVKPRANYKYFNKPFGTLHWMEQTLGFSARAPTGIAADNPLHDDTVVILMDPDQIILRPFRNNNFTNDAWKGLERGEKPLTSIQHGQPMGQMYGFSLQWKTKVTMAHVADTDLPSPVDALSNKDATRGYIVGPPYIATARDLYAIVRQWCIFVPRVHDQYPHLLAEMFAYSLAAAHLRLPHQTAQSFMLSSPKAPFSESWKWIDDIANETAHLCPVNGVTSLPLSERQEKEWLPRVYHFCQRYSWGPYFFGKYRFPKTFLSCSSPLLAEPPSNLFSMYDKSYHSKNVKTQDDWKQAKREAFGVCTMIPALNQAATYYKLQNCVGDNSVNWNKSYVFLRGHPDIFGSNYTFF